MTSRGPFRPKTFYDSMILYTQAQSPLCVHGHTQMQCCMVREVSRLRWALFLKGATGVLLSKLIESLIFITGYKIHLPNCDVQVTTELFCMTC